MQESLAIIWFDDSSAVEDLKSSGPTFIEVGYESLVIVILRSEIVNDLSNSQTAMHIRQAEMPRAVTFHKRQA